MSAAHEQLTTFKSSLSEVITSPTDETQCGNCDRMVIASEFKVLTDVKNTCLRGDRPNWRNNDSCFSSIKQKTSPGPYVGLDDGLGGNGTSLWTAHATHGGTSTIVTSNLAGIKCGIEAAVSKPAQTFVEKQGNNSAIAVKGAKSFVGHIPEFYTNKINTPGYNKPTYPVLVGDFVRVYTTKDFASLPHRDTFMVKERIKDDFGVVKAKLTLKCNTTIRNTTDQSLLNTTHDDVERDDVISYGEPLHFRGNCTNPGYVVFTHEGIFNGNMKYPLPTRKATDNRIGKGGNGFVFTIIHGKREYAVKKTVYRANEVNVHAALRHENILPLVAVLMGERHEHHSRKFYCYHFMPKMDCDLRQIMSTREVGCLKHFYNNCGNDLRKWETGFSNIKFILGETLKALAYLHENGYVHRDVKASNIMIKMQCRCQPLSCRCSSKFQVKLGDFDSAGTVPGLGIKEPTDQMIKFASILPLGTPGYRAPEVSMHITLSGPYETLYTFAVDMWSFGCLCLNICIGKTAALRQREVASLLLSRSHSCSKELWEKATKIKEFDTKAFSHEVDLITLVKRCLQVNSIDRPSAKQALSVFQLATKAN